MELFELRCGFTAGGSGRLSRDPPTIIKHNKHAAGIWSFIGIGSKNILPCSLDARNAEKVALDANGGIVRNPAVELDLTPILPQEG